MGIFKALGKFFEAMDQEENNRNQLPPRSPEELEREKRREQERSRRRQRMELERAQETQEEKIDDLRRKADKQWTLAREYLKAGQKSQALQAVQAHDMLRKTISQLQRRSMAFDVKIAAVESGATAINITRLLGEYATSLGMDMAPEDVADAFGDLDLATATVDEIDHALEKQMARDERKLAKQDDSELSASESMKILESEIAGEMAAETDGADGEAAPSKEDAAIHAEAEAGLKELQRLMDDDRPSAK